MKRITIILLAAIAIIDQWVESFLLKSPWILVVVDFRGRLAMLLMAAVFALGLVSLGFAADIKGTVAKIEGNRLTIQDDMGKQMAVDIPDPKAIQDLKIGDRVVVTQVGNLRRVLREDLGLIGTKKGCDNGNCGSVKITKEGMVSDTKSGSRERLFAE